MIKSHFSFKWYDMWFGAFYDTKKKRLYICPLPCCVFEFWRPISIFRETPVWKEAEGGRTAYCQHDVAIDVHCCVCHDGFLFDGMQHSADCSYYDVLKVSEHGT